MGAFSNVKARRTALGADLVTLVRPFWMQSQVSCGVGWIGGYNVAPISNYANHAYSVVSEGSDRVKTGYYCHVTSFVHELGHNMGLMHDRANAGTIGLGKTNLRDNQASVAPARAGAHPIQKACCVAL